MQNRLIWIMSLAIGLLLTFQTDGAPTRLVDEKPVSIVKDSSGVFIVDFGRVAFGNVRLMPPAHAEGSVVVHFGEDFVDGRVNRNPPNTVRYNTATVRLNGDSPRVAAPLADKRNTEVDSPRHPPAILTPPEWGVVLPFRWIEIEEWPGELLAEQIARQAAFSATWDDDAAAFESSDDMLNRIWELCRYSIKATTFAGVYVDGDRERIPYEADAYLNQLSHYYSDNNIQMARDTIDHLMVHGTWPTEWAPHMVFMAYADWWHTGDIDWLRPRYEALKSKMLLDRVGADGFVNSNAEQIKRIDIVDWPAGERDGYVRTRVNTVVNAFYLRAMTMMSEIAGALGHADDADEYARRVQATRIQFQDQLYDARSGLFKDGLETDHVSLHANLFPLAFGLAPEQARASIAEWLTKRGMRCSVYAAQYLMEALFQNGADVQAVELMTADNDRSWRHMVECGATITWEAWDHKYKSNQDWNHAWGAAPANLLPRYILGAEALRPGWEIARIRPCIAGLSHAKGKVPTPRGPVCVDWTMDRSFRLMIQLPAGMAARVELPVIENAQAVFSQGKQLEVRRRGDRWILQDLVSGTQTFEVR